MIILHDGNPLVRIRRPYVNWALVGLCVIVFVLQATDAFQWKYYAFFPAQLWHWQPLPGPLNGLVGLFAHMFLHADLLHIASNLTALFVFGNNIEDAMGHWRYLLFYLLSGAAAAVGQGLLSDPWVPLIGASGAVSAVMGAYLLLHPRARVLILAFNIAPVMAPAAVVVGFNVVVNIAMAYDVTLLSGGPPAHETEFIAWYAHNVGFVCGFLLVPLLKAREVRLFQAPPLVPARTMRWLGRAIPALAWPGDRQFGEDAAAARAAVEHPARAKLLFLFKALLFIVLILVFGRILP